MKHKTTMYRQGRGWIVSRWAEQYQSYELSTEMPHCRARAIVGRDNCRNPETCTKPTHDHRRY